MKVMMLNPSLSAEGYTHNLCNALADAGWEVDLYTGPHFYRVPGSVSCTARTLGNGQSSVAKAMPQPAITLLKMNML